MFRWLFLVVLSSTSLADGVAKHDFCSGEFWKTASSQDLDSIQDPDLECGQGIRIVHMAAWFAEEGLFREFLQKEPFLDAQESNGFSALMWAVIGNRRNIVKTLIEAGADVGLRSRYGYGALFLTTQIGLGRFLREEPLPPALSVSEGMGALAKRNDRLKEFYYSQMGIALDLVEAGAEIDQRSIMTGNTTLMVAAYDGYVGLVDVLIQAGAKLDLQNGEGKTALMMAAWQDHYSIAEMLVKAGAGVDIEDAHGRTAWHYNMSSSMDRFLDQARPVRQ